jgi:hypothetical protein
MRAPQKHGLKNHKSGGTQPVDCIGLKEFEKPGAKVLSQDDVEWLTISEEKLGEGNYGIVYRGKVKFRGHIRPQRVAVKRYRDKPLNFEGGTMDDAMAMKYQKCIGDLREQEVALPKMGMLKTGDGQWVTVIQSFEKGGKTKLGDDWDYIHEPAGRLFFAKTMAQVVNAGYAPHVDLFGTLSDGKGMIPLDLDSLVRLKDRPNNPEPETMAVKWISQLAMAIEDDREAEKEKMFRQFLNTLKDGESKMKARKTIEAIS